MTNPSGPNGPAFDPYRLWLQVPENTRPPTHYQLLGLTFGESNDEVIRQATLMRSAYVRHFQNGPNAADANRILEELAEANRVLLDPELRTAYAASVKPAPRPAARPPSVSASKPVVVQPPKTPTADYEVADRPERKPKKKAKRPKWRRNLVSNLFGIVVLGAALGVVAYLINVYNRSSTTTLTKADAPSKEGKRNEKPGGASTDAESQTKPATASDDSKAEEPKNVTPPVTRPRPPDALVVRLSVDPSDARLILEPIGEVRPGAPQASLEGEGNERTIVAEKGSLPLVVAASGAGYQSNRITVFSSDVGRLVVVQLQKEGGGGSFASSSSPSSFPSSRPGSPNRRAVGAYQVGIPLSSKDSKPVWKYTVARPAFDWTSRSFGDALWNDGEAAFGTRVGKNAIKMSGLWIRSPWASREIWMRARVELPSQIKGAMIRWTFRNDDSIDVYVNGVHQFSERTTNWPPATRVLDGTNFQPGENVIAVHGANAAGPGLVDLGFEWVATEEAR